MHVKFKINHILGVYLPSDLDKPMTTVHNFNCWVVQCKDSRLLEPSHWIADTFTQY